MSTTVPGRRQVLRGLAALLAAPGVLGACSADGVDLWAPDGPTTIDRETTTMTTTDTIDRLREAINSHDPRRVADCFTSDYRSETPHRPAEGFTGSDRVLANWTAIFARLPDLQAQVLRRTTGGSELWSEWEMVGTGLGGVPAVMRGPVIMTVREGRIDWTRFYLSAVSAPVAVPTGG